MSHPYAPSPKGHVVISRSSVLTLSGWSNTQFAYWARRAEGVSVLCNRDRRLRTVAKALERRLKEVGVFEFSPLLPESPTQESKEHKLASPRVVTPVSASEQVFVLKDEPLDEKLTIDEIEAMDPERWVKTFVTGKGLDVIIDEVKKRCGVSQFLRGKHSSLDPFGASVDNEETGAPVRGETSQIFMPTFQAESYVHEAPSGIAIKGEAPSPPALLEHSEIQGAIKRKASPEPVVLPEAHLHAPPITLEKSSSTGSNISTEVSQGLTVPQPSYAFSESPISPISPLSPVTPLSAVLSSSLSAPAIRQPSPTTHLQHTPVIVHSSPTSLRNYDSQTDSVCSKLNMQGIRLTDASAASTPTYSFAHSPAMTPLTPSGISRASPPDHYHLPQTHIYRNGQREIELAQARCAQSFNLSIPQVPERKHKKQKISADHDVDATGMTVGESATPVPHMSAQNHGLDELADGHLPGFYTNFSQQTGSDPSSPASWHGHSATPV